MSTTTPTCALSYAAIGYIWVEYPIIIRELFVKC